jgi:tRNA(Ile2)-agmatinylcytidine synthase
VVFSIKDQTAEVDCAAYEPTGALRKIARELTVGDEIEVFGAVRKPCSGKPLTLNLEKLNVLRLVAKKLAQNPACPDCGKRLKSMGKNQGLRCEKCKVRFRSLKKLEVVRERTLTVGLHVTSTRSQRHLTKPLRRYGIEKRVGTPVGPIAQWHSAFHFDL